ncbi:MAG: hypothetical protein M1831_005312 [Alyxoria varia]|nr:MAG: hypothetical protein M1831_005312 [Alyxoria varia]
MSQTYELPHRTYATCRYPVQSPSGSTIIVYGHQDGVTVVWKGGRRPKARQPADSWRNNSSARGSDADVIVIDSDDEEPANKAQPVDKVEFEDDENETDPSGSHESIVAVTTIKLGTDVHHVSAAPLPEDAASRIWQTIPQILQRRLVVAVACDDRSVRLLSLHLDPMGPEITIRGSADKRRYGLEESTVIGAVKLGRSLPKGVALTFTGNSSSPTSPYADAMEIESKDETSFELLVATCYTEPCGLVIISTLPASSSNRRLEVSNSRQTYLSSLPVTLAFNPSRYPSKRHTQLLIADVNTALRICDVHPQPASRRRGSIATLTQNNHEIQWLISLFPPSHDSSVDSIMSRSIADAKWCMDGKCIIVLLTNGQWGLWDLEDCGPSGDGHALGDNISGGSLSSFALYGFLRDREDNRPARKSMSPASDQEDSPKETASLAPMTPRTRRVKRESLFTSEPKDRPIAKDDTARGGISVSSSSYFATRKSTDDSILFWYGSNIFHIPSLMSYWQRAANPRAAKSSKSRGSDSFGNASPPLECRIPHLIDVSTSGESVTAIVQFPHRKQIGGSDGEIGPSTPAYSKRDLQHDVLIAAEHRFTFFCPERRPEEQRPAEQLNALFEDPFVDSEPQGRGERNTKDRTVQNMLKKGELGLNGINGLLEGMEQEPKAKEGRSIGAIARGNGPDRRRVGFAAEG